MGTTHTDWWEAVKQLSAAHRFVAHEPETPRYARARQKLKYLVRDGVSLGASRVSADRIGLAVWAPPEHRRGPGYYGCFRLFIQDTVVTGAVLYCFYDGTESSPSLPTLQDAQALAHANGFVKETNDEAQD